MSRLNKKSIKKAELTSAQLVGIILLVVGFAIILIFWSAFSLSGRIDKEACHESVVLRSSFNFGPIEAGKTIPLRCQTEKICLSMSGEDCEEFGKPTKKYPVTKIKLNKNKDEAIKEVKEAIANALYDCHSMLGEGKLDFMNHEFETENYCLICSRFAFDKQAKENLSGLSYKELYQYMEKQIIPSGKSYLEYVYPGWHSAKDAEKIFEALKEQNSKLEKKNLDFEKMEFEDWKIETQGQGGYAIIAQMMPQGTWVNWAKIGGVIAGGVATVIGITAIPVSGPVGIAIATAGIKLTVGTTIAAGSLIYIYDHPNEEYKYASPVIFPYNLNALKRIGCSSFETAP